MKRIVLFACLMAVFVALFIPFAVLAGGVRESKVVFGGEFILKENEVLAGDLVVFGGKAELRESSEVQGNIAFFGGELTCSGSVTGDVVGFGGKIALQQSAQVGGDVLLYGSTYQQEEGARVVGQVLQFESLRPFSAVYPFRFELPNLDWLTRGWTKWSGFLFRVFAWSALAILGGLLFPRVLERISNVVRGQAFIAWVVGLVSVVVISIGIILLAITLILSPIAFLGFILAVLGWFFGILAVGLETGRRLAEALRQTWSLPITAGVGTFLLVFVINGVSALVPCVGWIVPFSVGLIGFGAVILTQFGLKEVDI
ncbi:MAG: hypothetical protein ANABAC_2833 [Anaerolineae bacterium]|jgi:hypothetical protein|nr:MAG: hypothetical protein ANABAC_2833 [Anaerolineae bacterium]